MRWWTRDHYNKYGTKCTEEPCGPIFYVQVGKGPGPCWVAVRGRERAGAGVAARAIIPHSIPSPLTP